MEFAWQATGAASDSMSHKGNCWDNAVTEALFGSLNVKRLNGERFTAIRPVKNAVLVWLLRYSPQRCTQP